MLPDGTLSKRRVRLFFAALLLVSVSFLGVSFATDEPVRDGGVADTAPPASGVTVITTQDTRHRIREAEIVAYGADGERIYYNNSLDTYFDVDPSPVGNMTVLYTGAKYLNRSQCYAKRECFLQVIERANLTTGEVERLHAERTVGGRWHDVDRLSESNYLIADIYHDRAYAFNATSGIIWWEWEVERGYPLWTRDSAGSPSDWTHLNDVNRLDDGRIMVSLRAQDEVAFVHPERGLLENWTLGETGNHDILRDQHNPDYIPKENGGPAVLVADSSNDRAVEYQRVDGEWKRTWVYQSNRTAWTRDADRLPNGHTLITGTHGDNVFEVDEAGNVVWSVHVDQAYEAERLGTGDESAGGPSAAAANLTSVAPEPTAGSTSTGQRVEAAVKGLFPPKLVNTLRFITPIWMTFYRFLAFVTILGVAVAWPTFELRRSERRVELRSPIRIR